MKAINFSQETIGEKIVLAIFRFIYRLTWLLPFIVILGICFFFAYQFFDWLMPY
jgi:hypothetical protein